MAIGQSLHAELACNLRERIEYGEWKPGDQLPSIRALASDLDVSPVTVSRAFQVLRESGAIETIHGKGTFVAERDEPELEVQAIDHSWQNALLRKPAPTRANAIVHPLVQRYEKATDTILLAGGGEAADVLPMQSVRTVWRKMLNEVSSDVLSGWSPAGEEPVRAWMADYLRGKGLNVAADGIIVTTGGQQALSLATQTLLQPNDTVLVERPTYPFALSIFESLGVRCVDVPVDEHGLRVDIAEDLMARFRPKLVFTVPTGHAPTGVTMPLSRRRTLLNAARQFGVMILEDDHMSELSYDGVVPPAIKSLDTHGHVVYAKSFSKITHPTLRIGCLVAEGPIMDALVHAKLISDRYTSTLTQLAFLTYMTAPGYERDLERCRTIYRHRRDVMLAALDRYMPDEVNWTIPVSSFCLWLTLPEGISAQEVARRAAANGVVVASGAAFMVRPELDNALRLTFTTNDDERLSEGVRRLANVIDVVIQERDSRGLQTAAGSGI